MTQCGVIVVLAGVLSALAAERTAVSAQVPVPFPTAGSRPAVQTPPDASLGLPVYPASTFLETMDAGKGQQYYLYGTDTPFEDIVTYYKNTLRNGGRQIFQAPQIHQFELGRFDEDAMAFPPSVVVKDYTWNGAQGYLYVAGTTSTRYKTVIQIVRPPER
jgi:hypothetical protein